MNTVAMIVVNLVVFVAILGLLYFMQKRHLSFNIRVLIALSLGIVCGAVLQLLYGPASAVTMQTNVWVAIVGTGYVNLLKMIVIPLVFVAITVAITNIKQTRQLGKIAGQIIAVLVITAAIAAIVGVIAAKAFGLNAANMQGGENEAKAAKSLETRLAEFQARPIPQQIIDIIPSNPFYAMTGQGPSPTLSVVFFSALIGIAVLGLKQKKPASAEFLVNLINSIHDVVMGLVTIVLRLTPFGVLALMTRFVSSSNFAEIARLITFVGASYVAILVMFGIHMLIIAGAGLNPVTFIRKSAPALAFAFSSRSSAGTLPLTVQTQVQKLGVPESFASLAASLGISIGQNGCAGIYPAMLAVMIAPTVGINPFTIEFLVPLVIIVGLGSFGIAGVGGGATFAALTVLSAMGLPVGLVGLLIAIEPLIDMGRTALNVSDALVAGVVTSRLNKELDITTYAAEDVGAGEMVGA
jgi:uncharacterized protein